MTTEFKQHTFAELATALLAGKYFEIEGSLYNPYKLVEGRIVDCDCDPNTLSLIVGSTLTGGKHKTRIIEPPTPKVKYLKPISQILEQFPDHRFTDDAIENTFEADANERYRILYKHLKFFGRPLSEYPVPFYNKSWVEEREA